MGFKHYWVQSVTRESEPDLKIRLLDLRWSSTTSSSSLNELESSISFFSSASEIPNLKSKCWSFASSKPEVSIANELNASNDKSNEFSWQNPQEYSLLFVHVLYLGFESSDGSLENFASSSSLSVCLSMYGKY